MKNNTDDKDHEDDDSADEVKPEKWYWMLLQISIPFIIAGFGTITAGIILGNVEEWTVFKEINSLFMIVPPLCGLKGNLDMCIASRLSTLSNLGQMREQSAIQKIVVGNLALVQTQAIVCSMLLAFFTIIITVVIDRFIPMQNAFIIIGATMFTATTSCLILDSVLMGVIIFSQKYKFNPDYMATPFVASLGDIVSISLYSFSAALIAEVRHDYYWIGAVIFGVYLLLLPIWIWMVLHNEYTKPVLKYGWAPVLIALCISNFGGLVLSDSVKQYRGFAVFSPIISGIGGNLVSIQASSMGTILYRTAELGTFPPKARICERPDRTLFYGTPYARVARLLICISIPANVGFVYLADYLYQSESTITHLFAASYVIASVLLLVILLCIAHFIVHLMWHLKIDPDSSTIPYLTGIGDLLGTGMLTLMFIMLSQFDHKYSRVKNPIIKFADVR